MDLQQAFGDIDIYLFDQLLKGRLRDDMRVLDAGCGGGRNLVYLLREGYDVKGVDADPQAIESARRLADSLAPRSDAPTFDVHGRFRVAPVEAMPFADSAFDFIVCNAVLHFARDETHWRAMIAELARVLAPGGVFFARLMTITGIETLARPLGGRRYRLPSGSEHLLADEALILEVTAHPLRARLIDPLKSTVVHGQRTMTTWVVQRTA